MSSSSRSTRSLTTSPVVTRSPVSCACSNMTSTALAKWDPNTSAEVVPASTSPAVNSASHRPGVVDVGEPRLLGQGALLEPLQQRHAQAADDADLGEVDVRVDQPRQQQPPAQVDDLDLRVLATDLLERAAGDDEPAGHQQARVGLGAQPPPSKGLSGVSSTVAAVEDRRRPRSLIGSPPVWRAAGRRP